MTFEEFKDLLKSEVAARLDDFCEITFREVHKNNGVLLNAMLIREADAPMSPSIYLEQFYREFQQGVPIRHLARLIVHQYYEAKTPRPAPADFFQNYEDVRDKIFCRLVSYEKNKENLADIPYERWMDLAVTYYYQVDPEWINDATIQIRNEHLQFWGIRAEELKKQAMENSMREKAPVCRKLSAVLEAVGEEDGYDGDESFDSPLYLLSNRSKCFGAVCISYPGELEAIADFLQSDYYVLPSSIHECLILPDDGEYLRSELDDMVRQVNETKLSPQEYLSDHVYRYSRAEAAVV